MNFIFNLIFIFLLTSCSLSSFQDFPVEDQANLIPSGYQTYLNSYLTYVEKINGVDVKVYLKQSSIGQTYDELKSSLKAQTTNNSYVFLLSLAERRFDLLSSPTSLLDRQTLKKEIYPIVTLELKKQQYSKAIFHFLNFLASKHKIKSPMEPKEKRANWPYFLLIIPLCIFLFPLKDLTSWSLLLKGKETNHFKVKPYFLSENQIEEVKTSQKEIHQNLSIIVLKKSSHYLQVKLKIFIVFFLGIQSFLYAQQVFSLKDNYFIFSFCFSLAVTILIPYSKKAFLLFTGKGLISERVYSRGIDYLNSFSNDLQKPQLVVLISLRERVLQLFPNTELRRKLIQSDWIKLTQVLRKEIKVKDIETSLRHLGENLPFDGQGNSQKLIALSDSSIKDSESPS